MNEYEFRDAGEDLKRAVFSKGTPIPGFDPERWRMDAFAEPMDYEQHGTADSKHGWQIGRIDSEGSSCLANLRPVHWTRNRSRLSGERPRGGGV